MELFKIRKAGIKDGSRLSHRSQIPEHVSRKVEDLQIGSDQTDQVFWNKKKSVSAHTNMFEGFAVQKTQRKCERIFANVELKKS